MDILVDIDDEHLLRLLLLAKTHGRSLDEELRDILKRAAMTEKRRRRKQKRR